jgi:hypothetical protein
MPIVVENVKEVEFEATSKMILNDFCEVDFLAAFF